MERFLLFVALGVYTAFGQGAPATGILSGKVLDATTKEGVRKATVYATAASSSAPQPNVLDFKPPPIYSTQTDAEGVFRFVALKPGPYTFRVEKPGFLERPAGKTAKADAVAGQEGAAPDLTLAKQAVIAGRVTDSDGEPIEQANVQAIPVRRSGPIQGGMTDDRGEFRIPRLEPGAYLLLATKPGNNHGLPNVPATGEQLQVNAPTYFPSALDAQSASRIRVTNGDERTGLEIRLQKTVAVQVSGRVSGDLPPNTPVFLSMQTMGPTNNARGRATNHWGAIAGSDGRFVFANVTPGEHFITGSVQRPGRAQQLSGLLKVSVGRQNIDDLNVALQPPARITGRVTAEGGAKLPYEQILIGLQPVEPGMPVGGGGTVKPDGTFLLENLQRVRYAAAGRAPKGWFLKSVSVGGDKQPGLEFELTGEETAMEFRYSNRPGNVEVTLEGSPEAGPTWVAAALPDTGTGPPILTNLYSTVFSGPAMKMVKMEGVAPGSYYIVICPQRALQTLGESEVWESLKAKAAKVKVEEGGTVAVTVRLMTESDFDEN